VTRAPGRVRRALGAPRRTLGLALVALASCGAEEAGTLVLRPGLEGGEPFRTTRGAELELGPAERFPVSTAELEFEGQGWVLVIDLTEPATARLRERTAALVGRPLAVMAGEEVWTAPRVAEPLGPRVALPLPDASSREEATAARRRLLGG
jgi:hypothetical protein